jgi:hypothetical protein
MHIALLRLSARRGRSPFLRGSARLRLALLSFTKGLFRYGIPRVSPIFLCKRCPVGSGRRYVLRLKSRGSRVLLALGNPLL